MVKTRTGRRSYASDEDSRIPGSLPGGPIPIHNRVRELRDAISGLAASPRLPAERVFVMLQEGSPARRHGTLEHAAHLPSAETPLMAHTVPLSPLTPLSQMGTVHVGRVAREFEFPLAADRTLDSIADASFRTADPESAPQTPAVPRASPSSPPRASTEATPAVTTASSGSKKDGGEQLAIVTPATPDVPVVVASATAASPVPPVATPVVKFSAPFDSASTGTNWQEVTEGAVVDAGGWVTAVKRSPAKPASTAVKVPAISGPQSFPPWYLHFNSGDNSGVPDEKGSDKEEGPSNRPSSRASSSMPSLVSDTATSSAGPFRSEPVTAPPSSRATPEPQESAPSARAEPQPLRPGEEPVTISSYVRKLRVFSENALNKYLDEGLDAALAYMSSVFPEHHVTLLSVWLDYVNRSANSASRTDPEVLIGLSQGRVPWFYADPEPEPEKPRRKTYSEAARTSPTPSHRPLPDPIGSGRPGKGKGVDPRERPTATSTPKSVRFSFSDASTLPSYRADSAPTTPGILRPPAATLPEAAEKSAGTAAPKSSDTTATGERTHKPLVPAPGQAGNGHGGNGGGGNGGGGNGGGGGSGGGPPGGGPPGGGPPDGGRGGGSGNGNGPPAPPPPPPPGSDPTPPGGGDPDDSAAEGLADSESDGDDDEDDLRARRKLVSQMKIKHPRVYDGRADVDVFDHWCHEVDLWKRMNGVRTKWAISLMSGFLGDKALRWFMNNVVLSKETWTMRKFYDELFDHCFPSDFKLMLRKRFAQSTQGSRDVREFARDIQVLSRRFPDIGERQLIQVLWEGVHAYIRSKWFDYGFNIDENSFEQLVSAAEQFEKGERARTGVDKHVHVSNRVHGRANSERSANWRDRAQFPPANGKATQNSKNWVRSNAVGFQSRGRGGFRGASNRGGARGNANVTPLRSRDNNAPRREELSPEEKSRLQAEGRCFICKSEGHFSRNCPARMQAHRPTALHSNAARVSKPVKAKGEKLRAHGIQLQDDVPYDERKYSDDNALQLSGMRLLIDHPENEAELAYAKPYIVQEVLMGKFKNYFGNLTSMDGTIKMHVDRRFTVEYHEDDNSFLVNDWGTGDAYEVYRDDFLSGDMRVSAIVRRHVERHAHGDGGPTIASLRDLSIPNERNPDYAPDQAVVFVGGEFRLLSNEQAHNLGLSDQRYVILRSRGRTYVRDLETGLDYHVTPEIVAAGISIPAVLDHAETAITVEPRNRPSGDHRRFLDAGWPRARE
ncbi:hypothetical protein AURDEDRAFT_177451 [Auricularia subglabra TFB-10046 SS5]|uniref:CCHC-type domain-containing protein n=1 Tax=Auricularia subglabra (strain TFB-10046 / SS5) TaxID=717982 RepID=J0D455_AURST|nr:hypothetical protein AURDEDRAFT_177451 [Auricularia subglabra TFB-10046 SS5]